MINVSINEARQTLIDLGLDLDSLCVNDMEVIALYTIIKNAEIKMSKDHFLQMVEWAKQVKLEVKGA